MTTNQTVAVQTEHFHGQKQKDGESVDDYAQDIHRFDRKVYGKAQQGSSQAEKMGRSVLAASLLLGYAPN